MSESNRNKQIGNSSTIGGGNDHASIGSRQSSAVMSDTLTATGKSDGMFSTISGRKAQIHPMVRPFYSNLEVMDFLASQKMNVLVQRADKSKVMHRDERQYQRRKMRMTPDLHSPAMISSHKKRLSKMDLSVFQSHDERSQHGGAGSELRHQLDSGFNSRDERMLESAGGVSAFQPNGQQNSHNNTMTMNRNNRTMLRTIQKSPLETYNEIHNQQEANLRSTLIARINNFLPAHKHDYCEKRFQNSSIKEMQNAIGRNRHVQMARSQQSKLLKDFKDSQSGVYEEVLDKSKKATFMRWRVLGETRKGDILCTLHYTFPSFNCCLILPLFPAFALRYQILIAFKECPMQSLTIGYWASSRRCKARECRDSSSRGYSLRGMGEQHCQS